MFREFNKNPSKSLPPYSQEISDCIMRVHDATDAALEDMDEDLRKELIMDQLKEHLPSKLQEVGIDRAFDTVPLAYLKQVVCAATASKIVYREGLGFIQSLPTESLASIAFDYLQQEKKVLDLMEQVKGSGMDGDAIEQVNKLLLSGGIRAGVEASSHKN